MEHKNKVLLGFSFIRAMRVLPDVAHIGRSQLSEHQWQR